jgi:hypothetical protein
MVDSMRYIGSIGLGKESARFYEVWRNDNPLRVLFRKLTGNEELKRYVNIHPFDRFVDYAFGWVGEAGAEYILTERLPEELHGTLGDRVDIGVDNDGVVTSIAITNHRKGYFDDWGAFSTGTPVPFRAFRALIGADAA